MSCLTNGFSDSTSPTTAVPIGANSTTTTALDSFISSILSAVTIDEPKLCTSCEDGATAKSKCIDCGVDLCDRCVKLHQRSCSTRNHRISRLSWPSNDSAISLPQNALNGMAGDPSQMSANSAGPSSSMSLTQPNSNALVPSSLPPQPIGPPSHNYMLSLPSASSPLSGSGTSGISSSSPNYTLRPSSASTLSGGTGGNTMHICDIHKEPCRLFCQSCCAPACTECVLNDHHHGHQLTYIEEAADTARQQGRRLAAEARVAIASLREVADNVERTAHMIESGALQAAYDVRNTIRRYMIALEEREMNLLRMIDHTRQTKGRLIFTQLDSLRIMLSRLARTTDVLNECVDMPNPYDLISVNQRVAREIKQVQTMRLELGPCEEDGIMFLPPDANFMSAISSLGNITSSSAMVASRLARAQALKEQLFANFFSASQMMVSQPMQLIPSFPGYKNDARHAGRQMELEIKETLDQMPPPEQFPLSLRNRPIYNVKGLVTVKDNGPMPSLTFGREGDGDGKLCRPWGACCDSIGNFYIADRSNNRVQVFNRNGHFLFKFGRQGSRRGEFDRPAGIAISPQGHIIVADKDNHRIQVFRSDGRFLFTFGSKGGRSGQFNYPWDVACNYIGQIVVSDTRNHRIQLFTREGKFMCKFGFECANTMWKHFDSPRGVCFTPQGSVIVTDFNNHRIVIVDNELQKGRYLGIEGSNCNEFLRPQGIICDDEGNIVVADSKNNRIQVFQSDGNFLWKVGHSGTGYGEMDRPSGICLTPDGRIAVVDFGNHRIHVY